MPLQHPRAELVQNSSLVGGDRERGQQEGDGVVTLYVVVIHMSAPKGSLSKGARSAPRPFNSRRAARSGPLRRAQAIVIRL
eukprot:COSAG02_NODE_1466_length_12483_cov_37.157703_2_plen_81_part_00